MGIVPRIIHRRRASSVGLSELEGWRVVDFRLLYLSVNWNDVFCCI